MKKFLSLVLALVMTMSLVTIGAGATEYSDLSDKSQITYEEGVAVLNKLGIITGYTDGSFKPEAGLTRGAAAKIIVSLMIGSNAASNLTVAAAPYTDVATTNTFAAVISYCKTAGYISGYGDGTFRPSATLTGYAFAKMLLGALGYNGSIEGFSGSGWTMNVAKIGNLAGLFDGISNFSGNAAITREVACQLALNTLKADEVEYNGNNINVTSGDATVSITDSKYSKVEGKEANDYRSAADDKDSIMQFCEEHFSDLKLTATNGSDDFMRPGNTWRYKNSDIGTFAKTADLVSTVEGKLTKTALYNIVGSTVYDDIKADDSTLSVYSDGKVADSSIVYSDILDKNSTASISNHSAAALTGNGSKTEIYVDDSNNLTVVIINTYAVQAAADYSSSKETLTVSGLNGINLYDTTLDIDDFAVSDFKADDYILVTGSYKTDAAKLDIKSVEAATTVTGSVTAYSTGNNVTVAGTKYNFSFTANADTKATVFSTNTDAAVVLDAQGNVIYVDDATAAGGNFVFISKVAASSGLATEALAKAYFADGSDKEITLKKVTTAAGVDTKWNTTDDVVYDTAAEMTDADAITAISGAWYTYSVDSNSKYTLKSVAASGYTVEATVTSTGAGTVVDNGVVEFADSLYGNKETKFVVLNTSDDVDVYTGINNVPTVTAGATAGEVSVFAMSKSGYAKYVFIDASKTTGTISDGGQETSSLLYILKKGDTITNGSDEYVEYTAMVDGSETPVTITAKTGDFEPVVGSLYRNYKTNSDGYYTSATAVVDNGYKYFDDSIATADASYSGGVLTLATGSTYVISDSASIVLVGLKGNPLNSDSNANYVVNTYSGLNGARSAAAYLYGYTGALHTYVVYTTESSQVVETLYITAPAA